MGYYYFFLGLSVGFVFYYYRIRKIQHQNDKFFNLVERSKDIVYYCDVKPKLKYRYLSPAIDYFLGENVQQESYKNPYTAFERIHPDDFKVLEGKVEGTVNFDKPIIQRWKNDKGNYLWFEEHATPIYKHGELIAIQGIIRNIDEQIKLKKKLEYQVIHDPLTDVYNRHFFEREMERFDSKEDKQVALILCDLDNLKKCNDRLGHSKGDQLIQEVAILLNRFSNENIFVSRIGGDEFALLVCGQKETDILQIIKELKLLIHQHNHAEDTLPIEMSIGYAHKHSSIGKMRSLYEMSDRNMYLDKKSKKEIIKN